MVYFTHEEYVGVSAYLNKPDASSDRNANMLAVGALIRVEGERMGKGWLHVEGLKRLAGDVSGGGNGDGGEEGLQGYWEEFQEKDGERRDGAAESTDSLPHTKQANGNGNGQIDGTGYRETRSMSTGSAFTPGQHTLAPHHPARNLMEMVSVFGPLIFPVYRAALLRKRILLITEAPVEFACDVVYNLSVLSSLAHAAASLVPRGDQRRTKALFNVGVQDIDMLSRLEEGWIACSTDDVLATKPELFDLAVFMPNTESKNAERKVWPKIVESSQDLSKQFPKVGVRASQRDAVRYEGLTEGLTQYPANEVAKDQGEEEGGDDEQQDSAQSSRAPSIHEHKEVVEPASWSQVAYTSLLWWASAGDRRNGLSEEEEEQLEKDNMLLDSGDEGGRTKEVVVVSYFRRLTAMMFQVVDDVLRQEQNEDEAVEDGEERHDGSSDEIQDQAKVNSKPTDGRVPEHEVEHHHQPSIDEGEARPLVKHKSRDEGVVIDLTPEDVAAMGLDVWSQADRKFAEELVEVWWGRKARVRRGGVECCGVRIL